MEINYSEKGVKFADNDRGKNFIASIQDDYLNVEV